VRHVVGVRDVGDVAADQVVLVPAEQAAHRAVDRDGDALAPVAGADDRHPDRRAVERQAEALLGRAAGLPEDVLAGDVDADGDHVRDRAVVVGEMGEAPADPDLAPVARDPGEHVVAREVAAPEAVDDVLGLGAVLGGDPVEHAPGGELAAVIAADLAGGVVDVDGNAGRVDDDDEHRSGIESRGQHPVALRREADLSVSGSHVRLILRTVHGAGILAQVCRARPQSNPGTRQTAPAARWAGVRAAR